MKSSGVFHVMNGFEKRMKWIFPFCVLFLLMGIQYLQYQHGVQKQKSRMTLVQTASSLMDGGFSKEAEQLLERLPKPLTQEEAETLFASAMRSHHFQTAEQAWQLNPKHPIEALERLIHELASRKESAAAWALLCEHKDAFSEAKQKELAALLFEDIREWKSAEAFVDGWTAEGIAILSGAQGMFLVDASGNALDHEFYDEVVMSDHGFIARRGEHEVRLDPTGHFQQAVASGTMQWEKAKKKDSQRSFEVAPYLEEGKMGYAWHDMIVMKADFDRASPISPSGVGYFYLEGTWTRFRLNALRDGHAFNTMK